MNYEIILSKETREFLNKLAPNMRSKVLRDLKVLQRFGYMLKEPQSKWLKGYKPLQELRSKFANNICRLFYFYSRDRATYRTLSGYVEKSQKQIKGNLLKQQS